jgi:S-adenosylmethionine synthetase
MIDTFGTGKIAEREISDAVMSLIDLRPAAIIERFGLRRPIYSPVAAYGHMGREDVDAPWERTDMAQALANALTVG